MSPRAFVAVLVVLAVVSGGGAGIIAGVLAPDGCGESCCCDAGAPAAAPAGCCTKQADARPQLRASCGCGRHGEQTSAPTVSPVALPASAAAPGALPAHRAAPALTRRMPASFPSAPDPPPPRAA